MKKDELSVKDLMINDWVNVVIEGEVYPSVITMMDRDTEDVKVAFLAVPEDWEEGDFFDEIQPIPLTAEILEKNGFVLGKADMCHPKPSYCWCADGTREVTVVEVTLYDPAVNGVNVLTQIFTESLRGAGVNKLHSCDIENVHQLQHALRLCGIEKEISLI